MALAGMHLTRAATARADSYILPFFSCCVIGRVFRHIITGYGASMAVQQMMPSNSARDEFTVWGSG